MKPFTAVAVAVFALVAVLHLFRLLFAWEVTVGGLVVPQWVSVFGGLVAAGLAWMVWRESRR
jgi:hypothetical protein